MPRPTADPQYYRPAAGIAIFNELGQVWLGRRKGQKGEYIWQMPQGGIDNGEEPVAGALREMYEETGISAGKVKILKVVEPELYYDFPKDLRMNRRSLRWRGQRQTWLAVRFLGDARDVNLTAHPPQEFSEWRWGDLTETPQLIIPFKRKVYEQLIHEFEAFANPVK